MHHRGATACIGKQLAPPPSHRLYRKTACTTAKPPASIGQQLHERLQAQLFLTPLSVFSLGRFWAWRGALGALFWVFFGLGSLLASFWCLLGLLGRSWLAVPAPRGLWEPFWSDFFATLISWTPQRRGSLKKELGPNTCTKVQSTFISKVSCPVAAFPAGEQAPQGTDEPELHYTASNSVMSIGESLR